jgi:hypothetical protein
MSLLSIYILVAAFHAGMIGITAYLDSRDGNPGQGLCESSVAIIGGVVLWPVLMVIALWVGYGILVFGRGLSDPGDDE